MADDQLLDTEQEEVGAEFDPANLPLP